MMRGPPIASHLLGTSPSWIHDRMTPSTGMTSVPSPASPAERRCRANSHSTHATALARTTV